ncbi:hypothetical protein OESDEN_01683 [Oesophagostomum dentatum]|uniref:Uncharacterized protein n=1 Tax=Oesophagostomum dentatum TaxID=61180 RepID=A0A0B1TSE0_OESDE|nr:hypothetical protein OESDEN_01683 [Oesophagostomum dentatum]
MSLSRKIYSTGSLPPEASRNNTPRSTPAPLPIEPPKPTPTRVVDAFPEFKAAPDYDACSFVDDSTSITTSTEDESNFEIDVVPEEDDLDLADLAEDAAAIDDAIISDRIYKILMGKHGNILVVDLASVLTLVNVHNKNTLVLGKVDSVFMSEKMDVARSEAYGDLRKKNLNNENGRKSDPEVVFSVSASSGSATSHVQVTVNGVTAQLDDEIVSHLSAFALDEEVTENKVRLVIKVCDSSIEIRDRKKKKPMRLRIKECTIEQEEDGDST